MLLAEKDARAREALTHRCATYGARARIYPDDANEIVGAMLAEVPRQAPAFAFLDPEGSELDWRTVEAIARHKEGRSNRIEQLILFPTDMGFVRLAPDHPDMVTRIFGDDQWTAIYEERRAGRISADDARGRYVQLYADGLRRLGYATVLDRQIAMQTGQPMYFLIFATDHEAGERIMDHCFDQVRVRVTEELGQGTLFPMTRAPRRRRLDRE